MSTKTIGGSGYLSPSDSDGLYDIYGTAIGSNDVTVGHLSGKKKLWTPEVLEAAAHTLEGQHIVVDHENRSVREVVGEITNARFKDGMGVIYQGVIDDDELAEKIERGWLDVSPRIVHSEEMEERGDLLVPKEIFRFDNLSIVTEGASPSNSVDMGEHPEMTAEQLMSEFSNEDGIDELQHFVESEVEELTLSEARTPDYDGTETRSWGEIDGSQLEYYTENLDYDAESWDDLSQEQRNTISSHTLLGDPDADTAAEGIFFPVVNAANGNLNRGALEAVRSGRGQSADIPSDTYSSAFSVAGRLLNEEFDADVETDFEEMSQEEMQDGGDLRSAAATLAGEWGTTTGEALQVFSSLNPEKGGDLRVLAGLIADREEYSGVSTSDVLDALEQLENTESEDTDDRVENSDSSDIIRKIMRSRSI